MIEPLTRISLQQLQKISYDFGSPLQLQANGQIIVGQQLIRVVPGKRLVLSGTFTSDTHENEAVIIKLFVHASRAKKHWLREYEGVQLLKDKQIPTPENIARGVSDEGIYFLIFRYIKGQNLAIFWQANEQSLREDKLREVLSVLAQHHGSGLAHQDLHYANFYLGDDGVIYTLDAEEISGSPTPLAKTKRLENLALFLAQTFDVSKSACLSLLQTYSQQATLSLTSKDPEQFWLLVKYYQQQRIEQYLKKVVRECTEVIYEKTSSGYTLCRREYHTNELQQLLADPESYFNNKDSEYLKQGNTCTVKSVQVADKRYVLKRYNPKGIVYELLHAGQVSRARKSWINAHLLRFMEIKTPEPVALIEQQPALGQRCSYYISRYQPGQSSWDFFCDEQTTADQQLVADKLAAILKHLCAYHITHGDLKGSNFLIADNDVWLLDLDAMTRHKSNRRFSKNWQRDRQRFLQNWDKKSCYKTWKRYFNQIFADNDKPANGNMGESL